MIGGILGGIDFETNGTIATIAISGEETIKSGMVTLLGLGAIEITVTAECDPGKSAEAVVDGTQILFLTIAK